MFDWRARYYEMKQKNKDLRQRMDALVTRNRKLQEQIQKLKRKVKKDEPKD